MMVCNLYGLRMSHVREFVVCMRLYMSMLCYVM
jgi:hypothetical protein